MDEKKLNKAFLSLQRAISNKTDGDGGKYIREAIQYLDESLSSGVLVNIISAANYAPKEYGIDFIKSGIGWIDNSMGGGVRKEELVIIGGEWHSGKTHVLSYLGSQYLEGMSVLHFIGEDMLDDVVHIYQNAIYESTGEKNILSNLYFVSAMDTGGLTLDIINNAINTQKTDIVIIDHLDIIDSKIDGQDWLAVHKLTRDLKFMAKKYNIVIIAGSQAIDGRLFRGNTSKSMDADIVWYIEAPVSGSLFLEVRKGRGRKIEDKDKKIFLSVDWGAMKIELA